MRPIAAKLLKEIRKVRSSKVVDLNALRDTRAAVAEMEKLPDGGDLLPPNQQTWMSLFQAFAGFASGLLGLKALRKLATRIEAAEEEYMPGGPPMSPVLDSAFVAWWLLDLPIGPRRETVASIVCDIAPVLGAPREMCEWIDVLGQSRLGVYRVEQIGTDRVRLDEVLTGWSAEAHIPSDMKSRGPLWLTRLLPPIRAEQPSDWVVWTTPYTLIGPDALAQWTAYCERAAADGASEHGERALERYFKAADDPTRWLDYIMDGYAGVAKDTGAIVLRGVPDRPRTLPHHPDYEPPAEPEDPQVRIRSRLLSLSEDDSFEDIDTSAALRRGLDLPPEPLSAEADQWMTAAYLMYGRLNQQGSTALELLRERAEQLPADERELLESLSSGWFSAFEVTRIRLDEGMELRDLLRRRKLWVRERSGTRGLDLGDVLAGWVMTDGTTVELEGGLCLVKRMFAAHFVAELRKVRDVLARSRPKLGWKKRAGLLARYVVPLQEWALARAQPPKTVNFDGEDILFSTARYDVGDWARVSTTLAELFESDGLDSFVATSDGVQIAQLKLDGTTLRVRCNSRRRLDEMKTLVEKHLAGAIVHRLDSHQDPSVQIEEAWANRTKRPRPPEDRPELPPEAQKAIEQHLLEQMRRWIDEPIPLLGGKTPRQAVRSSVGRDHVTHLLFRQQEIFTQGSGLPAIDLTEIWTTLGLTPHD